MTCPRCGNSLFDNGLNTGTLYCGACETFHRVDTLCGYGGNTNRSRPSCWPKHKNCTHREYVGKACKRWGRPAMIVLSEHGYAGVREVDTGAVTEYSWTAVYNVFANRGGNFTD